MTRVAISLALALLVASLALVAAAVLRAAGVHPLERLLRAGRRAIARRRERRHPGVRVQIEIHGRPTPLPTLATTAQRGRKARAVK